MAPAAPPTQAASQDPVFARRVLLASAIVYPAWGAISLHIIPGAHEPLWIRGVLATITLGAWALSYLSPWVRERLSGILLANYLLVTCHYLGVVDVNDYAPMYVIGAFIAAGTINTLFHAMRPFLLYTAVVLAATIGLTLAHPRSDTMEVLLILGLATQQLLAAVSLQARQQAVDRLLAAQADLQSANAELRAADRYKNDFLSIISHELRTPLNAVIGFGSVLTDGLAGPLSKEQQSYVLKITRAGEGLLKLVDDLLTMNRLQAGKFQLDPRLVAFVPIVDEVLSNLGGLAAHEGQQITSEVPRELPPVVADPRRVAQVLTNLIANALKFSARGGRVVVRARVVDDRLRCEIEDQGEGIAAEALPRLFQPFSQVDTSTTRRVGGTGLGLSISKALVEAHGGTIGATSEVGVGSTFWFELPLGAPKH